MRTLVVGDIHGGLRGLQQVLIKAGYDPDEDRIIFLGDYVDGWSENAETVEYLIGIKNKANFNYEGKPKTIFIRGNHDVWCHDYLHTGHQHYVWTMNGGQATIDSYIREGHFTQEHRDFFKDLVNWYIDEENRLFVHAGWNHYNGFPEGAAELRTTVPSIYPSMECQWNRTFLNEAASIDDIKKFTKDDSELPIEKALKQFKEVYIGHTPARSGVPENYLNLWNLDTAAGWDGRLTIMDIDTKEYWQSDSLPLLYPEEKGRMG